MSEHASRRKFLQLLSGIGTGLLAAGGHSLDARAQSGQGCNGKRVAILGGGLAGLTAAYGLMNRGYEVIVLEGQDRVGGRVLTVRDGFQAGGHVEMGATRIFSTHVATLKYVNHFGLGPLVPYDSGNRAFYMRPALPAPAGRPTLAHRRHVGGREGQPLRLSRALSGLRVPEARRPRFRGLAD